MTGNQGRLASQSAFNRLAKVLPGADVLLVVPPFHALGYPSLAVHLLQACAEEAGYSVRVLYANMLLAAVIGEEVYSKICDAHDEPFTGERFFARCAFGLPSLGRRTRRMFDADWRVGPNRNWRIDPDSDRTRIPIRVLRYLENRVGGYVERVGRAVADKHYTIVGCSTSFEQTAASVALLSWIKNLRPETVTILGGANCEGEMALGIASLSPGLDYIFSGESEASFVDFVHVIMAGSRPPSRIIHGKPCGNLDVLPLPAYGEFYEQRNLFLSRGRACNRQTEIPYESSRGCWWGQKHHCTFCGFNEEGIAFRQKSPDRVLADLSALLKASPTRRISMTDSVMPYSYFRTLLPRLTGKFAGVTISYEQRARLLLSELLTLKCAGVTSIQPGIESLSSRLLSLMNKGVGARQNLILLRNAKAVGLDLSWNLLWGFPGDDVETYEETLSLIPLLHHLQPPLVMAHISIDRFSPYFSQPAKFGLHSLKPLAGYYDSLPEGADVRRIAYSFTAEYRCGSHDHMGVICNLWQAVNKWQDAWKQRRGRGGEDLRLIRNHKSYALMDTRRLRGKKESYGLSEADAAALLTPRPFTGKDIEKWAVHKKLAVIADGWFVPLATADPRILLELASEYHERPRTLMESPGLCRTRNAAM